MDIKVAERIAELMRDDGINQVQLAAKIGVKQNTVSSWVLGKRNPISAVCGVLPTISRWI